MCQVARIKAELELTKAKEAAVEEARVPAGIEPPLPMPSIKERMANMKRARIPSQTRSNLMHKTKRARKRTSSPPTSIIPCKRLEQIRKFESAIHHPNRLPQSLGLAGN